VWLAIGPGVTSRWGARATTMLARARPQAPARHNRLEARSAARGGAHIPCIKRHSATGGAQDQRSATASTRTWGCPGATNRRGGFTRGSADRRPGLERASRCVATAVLAHAQPCHVCSAQPSSTQRRVTERLGGTPNVPCKQTSSRRPVHSHRPRTATAGTRA
jgi:hypothetical protein